MKFFIDTHTHTLASGHAYCTTLEYIKTAKEQGVRGIAITDHAPLMPGSCGYVHFSNLHIMPKEIDGVRVYTGVELNILNENGDVDLDDYILKRLDVVMASCHNIVSSIGDKDQITNALVNVMDNKYVRVIGHLCDPQFPFDLEKVVLKAKETNTALEVNNSSLNPTSYRFDKERNIIKLLELCKEHKVFITLGSDSHFVDSLCDFSNIYDIIEETKFPRELIVNKDLDTLETFFGIKK